MLKTVKNNYDAQLIFNSATLTRQTIDAISEDCMVKSRIVVRCSSFKFNHIYYKIRNEDFISSTEYADGLVNLQTIKDTFYNNKPMRAIVVLRGCYEIKNALTAYKTTSFQIFKYHGDLPHADKAKNKEALESSNYGILLTVPSNLIGVNLKGCDVMIFHKISVSLSDLYQDFGRLATTWISA
uniref:Helicase C-terminal domain-containing protein n=1 Tax=Strongyloides papillosus TaxID=174720 RepID=A0A0N5BJZ7_STREA